LVRWRLFDEVRGYDMELVPAGLDGLLLLRPSASHDERGWFVRTMSSDVLRDAGLDHTRFVQQSQSRSGDRVIRGLHGRRQLTEAKLVRCSTGAIFDVVVDLRPWSPTFLAWRSFILDDCHHQQLYIPAGFAHGFQVLSSCADVCYAMDSPYQPGLDYSIAWNDDELGIPWPRAFPVLSHRDLSAPPLREVVPLLSSWFGDAPPQP
jgi:dTDP-4-dehydrorhamnose 3,5-epimerase